MPRTSAAELHRSRTHRVETAARQLEELAAEYTAKVHPLNAAAQAVMDDFVNKDGDTWAAATAAFARLAGTLGMRRDLTALRDNPRWKEGLDQGDHLGAVAGEAFAAMLCDVCRNPEAAAHRFFDAVEAVRGEWHRAIWQMGWVLGAVRHIHTDRTAAVYLPQFDTLLAASGAAHSGELLGQFGEYQVEITAEAKTAVSTWEVRRSGSKCYGTIVLPTWPDNLTSSEITARAGVIKGAPVQDKDGPGSSGLFRFGQVEYRFGEKQYRFLKAVWDLAEGQLDRCVELKDVLHRVYSGTAATKKKRNTLLPLRNDVNDSLTERGFAVTVQRDDKPAASFVLRRKIISQTASQT
jgi:hypothetical protein